jgi:hypothetical protein
MKWLVHHINDFPAALALLAVGYAVFCSKYLRRLGDKERKLLILIGIGFLVVSIVIFGIFIACNYGSRVSHP